VVAVATAAQVFEPNVNRDYYTPSLNGFFDAEKHPDFSANEVALNKIKEMVAGDWKIESSYTTKHNGVNHVYLRQTVNGIEVDNCEVNVNVDVNGAIISMGVSAYKGEAPKVSKEIISSEAAVLALAQHVELKISKNFVTIKSETENVVMLENTQVSSEPITASLVYVKVSEHEVVLAWKVRVLADAPDQPYGSYVGTISTRDSTVLSLRDEVKWFMPQQQAEDLAREFQRESANATADLADRASYLVYGIPNMDPNFGDRVTVTGLPDRDASPLGWFDQGNSRIFSDTRGNNVFAHDNPTGGPSWINNYRPNCGSQLTCVFPIDLNQQPVTYRDAAIVNLFWWNNVIHDIWWLRGFDEVSGNAQENNWGRGGRENDAVQANAQDGAGFNNANMLTPVDGTRGRMRMYLWNGITPMRDGDLDSGIIVHEYAHHISQRLTGGPLNVGCLSGGQAGGMGEGWGDFFATLFLQQGSTTRAQRFPMGLYAARRGIRPFPYSADRTGNPQTFGILNQGAPYNGVHAIGSVWCQILFQVYWEMRDEYGWNPDWWYGDGGNNVLLQDVTDGMKLQPCTPNFVQARDAILQADRLNYDGKHLCALWRGFALRGLGTGAVVRSTNSVTESFAIPPEC